MNKLSLTISVMLDYFLDLIIVILILNNTRLDYRFVIFNKLFISLYLMIWLLIYFIVLC